MLGLLGGLKTSLIIGAVVLAVAGGGWFYISHLQSNIEALKANNLTLEIAKQSQDKVIETMKNEMKEFQENSLALSKQYSELSLANAKKDVEYDSYLRGLKNAALKKTDYVEGRANDATAHILQRIAKASGDS